MHCWNLGRPGPRAMERTSVPPCSSSSPFSPFSSSFFSLSLSAPSLAAYVTPSRARSVSPRTNYAGLKTIGFGSEREREKGKSEETVAFEEKDNLPPDSLLCPIRRLREVPVKAGRRIGEEAINRSPADFDSSLSRGRGFLLETRAIFPARKLERPRLGFFLQIEEPSLIVTASSHESFAAHGNNGSARVGRGQARDAREFFRVQFDARVEKNDLSATTRVDDSHSTVSIGIEMQTDRSYSIFH